jgi:Ca2+-binding RTX toxin-like protein
MLAWQVLQVGPESLLIGGAADGDVGVLSYDAATGNYLLNGEDTGVELLVYGGLRRVRVEAGSASNTTFTLDFATPYPTTGVYIPEGTPPGAHVVFDGGANVNDLRIVQGAVRVRPLNEFGGQISVARGTINQIEYTNLRGTLDVVDAGITIDASDPNGSDRVVTIENGRASVHEQLRTPSAGSPTYFDTLNLTYRGGRIGTIYTGDGDDQISINLAGMTPRSSTIAGAFGGFAGVSPDFEVQAGAGNDSLRILGSDLKDTIALFSSPTLCGSSGPDILSNGSVRGVRCNSVVLSFPPITDWRFAPTTTKVSSLDVESRMIFGNGGDDKLAGGRDADSIVGGAGDDEIFGRGGDDTLYGGGDDDTILGEGGNDLLGAGEMITVRSACVLPTGATSCSFDTFGASFNEDSADVLDGGADNDILIGSGGPNLLLGGEGNDALSGRVGDDLLNGGTGRNVVFAGAGADRIQSLGTDLVVTGQLAGTETFNIERDQYALDAIRDEWSSDQPLATRVANISAGNLGGVDLSPYAVNGTTHLADGDVDRVVSRRAVDWLLATAEDLATFPAPRPRPHRPRTVHNGEPVPETTPMQPGGALIVRRSRG